VVRVRPVWLLAVAGAALAGAGAYQGVATSGGSGATAGVIAGSLLLVSPFLIHRMEHLSVTATGLDMQFTKDIADQGAPKAARILDRSDLAWYAQSYSFIHEELSGNPYREAKTHLQDLLVERAAAIARREKFDASEVRTLFRNAAPTTRVLALGLMQGDPSLADGASIVDAIENPHSPNEQYQGLHLALQCWPQLTVPYRAAVLTAIEASPAIKAGSNRRKIAEQILALQKP
jgi:hypothetical protein